MAKKFKGEDPQKCEAVRQAMRRVRRVGKERMSWATFYKEVSRLADFNNPLTVIVSVGLTTGYVASSLAVAPLPIVELLEDKPYWEADKLYFSRMGVRLAVNELSTRAQNCLTLSAQLVFYTSSSSSSSRRSTSTRTRSSSRSTSPASSSTTSSRAARTSTRTSGTEPRPTKLMCVRAGSPPNAQRALPRRCEMTGINQSFGEVNAMQLKRDRVRAYVWERVTLRFNAIAEKCEGVWDT